MEETSQKRKSNIWDKIQTGGVSLCVGLLLKLIVMFGNQHDDITKMKMAGERRDGQINQLTNATNNLQLGQYDINGRLIKVEALLQEQNNSSSKKNTQ